MAVNKPQRAPTLSILEKYAQEVAGDVYVEEPDEPQQAPGDGPTRAQAVRAGFIDTLIPMIIAIFTNLTNLCPQAPAQIASAVRRPTNRQKAALLVEIGKVTGPFRFRKQRELYQSMLARGEMADDRDARALVDEALQPDNMLI